VHRFCEPVQSSLIADACLTHGGQEQLPLRLGRTTFHVIHDGEEGRITVSAGGLSGRLIPCSKSSSRSRSNVILVVTAHKKNADDVFTCVSLIGTTGFKPATSRPPAERSIRLSHVPSAESCRVRETDASHRNRNSGNLLSRMRAVNGCGIEPSSGRACGYTAPDLVQRFHTLETSPVTFTQLLTVTKPDIVIFETFAAGWVAGPCDTLGVRFVVAVLCRTPRQTHG
jgi:hypothetical protein